MLGEDVGPPVGDIVGPSLGEPVGETVGVSVVGLLVTGEKEGVPGVTVGSRDGAPVGRLEGV